MSRAIATPGPTRRVAVKQLAAECLSCQHGTVRMEGEQIKVLCANRHRLAAACPDYVDDGRSRLLHAIVRRVRRTESGYRKVFNVVQPDCPNCTSNCCTRPFLQKTPFYGEDTMYYLLIGQPLPDIPKGVDHCIFFSNGCTLESHLRPHVCIEYKCPFTEQPKQIDVLGDRLKQDTIYLISVATRKYESWRGVYKERDKNGTPTGRIVDRFETVWNPEDPLADLFVRYGLAPRA